MFCAQIITIGDHPKAETRKFFRDRILPDVPERLRSGLDFEKLYEAFGGKFAHWQDYVTDYGMSCNESPMIITHWRCSEFQWQAG